MKKSTLLGLLCVGLLLLNLVLTGFMFWQKPQHPQHNRHKGGDQIFIDKLHLDETQSASYRKLRQGHMNVNEQLNSQLYQAYDDLFELLVHLEFDEEKKDEIFTQIEGLTTQLNHSNLSHFLSVKTLLSDDQILHFNAFTEDLRKQFGPNKGKMPPPIK